MPGTDGVNGLARRGRIRNGDHSRGHDAAGCLLVILEEPLNAGAIVDLSENRGRFVGWEVADQVGRIVILEFFNDVGGAPRVERGQ